MGTTFSRDVFTGRPRILFVGLAESTHTHLWIDLLKDSEFNVRLFALPTGVPPPDWPIQTYVTSEKPVAKDQRDRVALHPGGQLRRLLKRGVRRLRGSGVNEAVERWLAEVVRTWRPDVIHTLGLDPAGDLFFRVREHYALHDVGKWVLQLRGGSDLTLSRLDPTRADHIGEVLRGCDQLLSDNEQNYVFATEMGVKPHQLSTLGVVPGTGGIDVDALMEKGQATPSARRAIIWPKAYESPWSKALPVMEAITLSWDRIQPCEIDMFAMTPDVFMWYWALPEHIRRHCRAEGRVSRGTVVDSMVRARVMLAPSLIDGIPNTLFEAMAAGAFPILSPLDTIRNVVANEENVLFARNLYPDEIAAVLVRVMSDDALVEKAAEANLKLVRKIADRKVIAPRIVEYYTVLAQ